jgi:hypothetical protein
MLAVAWPFGYPARFADSGGAQTRYAQTVRALSPESAALLGHATRPGSSREAKSPLIIERWNESMACSGERTNSRSLS